MDKIFFTSWDSVFRTLIIGVSAYTGLIIMLRIAGNRTLSQLNAFDLIVTVALGSTLATVLLNKSVALVDGLLALALLIVLQFFISILSLNFRSARNILNAEPRLIYYRGEFVEHSMKKARVTRQEIIQVIRSNGIGEIADVDAVVIETNGKFSVIRKLGVDEGRVLDNVQKNV